MIVDALVDYEHPIFIYIPKHLGLGFRVKGV